MENIKELEEFVGSHFIYTYENGCKYEMYVKNYDTIDLEYIPEWLEADGLEIRKWIWLIGRWHF